MIDWHIVSLFLLVCAYAAWSTWWNHTFMRSLDEAADEIDQLTKENERLKGEQ